MLDTRSIIAALLAVLLAGIIVHVINWRIHPSMRGPRWWVLGFCLRALGLLMVIFRDSLPDWVIVVSYTLLVAGYMSILYGLALFSDRRFDLKLMATLLAIDVIGAFYFTLVEPLGFARSTVYVAVNSIVIIMIMAKLRVIARLDGFNSVIILLLCYVAYMILGILSIVITLIFQPGIMDGMEPSTILATIFLGVVITEAMSIFGFVLMTAGRSQRELRTMAMTDVLTGLPNRRAFSDEVTRALKDIQRTGAQLGLAIIDVDYFKKVNDEYGHDAGDKVLVHISDRIRDALRESDFVARIGGEEFALLVHAKGERELREVADRVRRSVEESPAKGDYEPLPCTVSIGIAYTKHDALDYDTLYNKADMALYQAKAEGRNQVMLAS